jgi:hypothetical protein
MTNATPDEGADMVTDDEIAELFAKVVRDLDPPAGVMVRRAEWIGRRRRARRRARIAAGNTLAISAVVGAGVLFGTHHAPLGSAGPLAGAATRHRAASPSPGARASHTAVPSPSPSPAVPTPTPSPGETAGRGMTPQQMLVTLRGLLPAGSVLSNVNPYYSGPGNLEVDYNDGKGAVDFVVGVFPPGTIQQPACPDPLWTDEGPRPSGALPISCAMRTLPDGSVERDAVMYADVKGFYGYDIYDRRPDGVTVFIQVGNGIIHTLPQVDRAQPPGSMAEWEAVAESPAWRV